MTTPRRDPHLGELASAFADDALDPTTRDRVLVHLAHCTECRAEVDGHRQVKARLAKLTPPPCPDSLLERLRALPECTPTDRATPELPPVRIEASFRSVAPAGRAASSRRPVAVAPGRRRPTGRRPGGVRPTGRRLRRKVVATAVGGVAAFALSLGTVVVLGGDQPTSTVNPPVLTYIKEHGAVTGGVPGGDREASVVDVADTNE